MAALLRGEVPPFVAPLAHVTARGHNLYFPIPYRSRCVVTTDDIVSPDPFTGKPIAKLYYQIGYRSYGADQAANVRPFSAGELARGAHALHRAATLLRGGAPPAPSRAGDHGRRRADTGASPASRRSRPSRRRRAAAASRSSGWRPPSAPRTSCARRC